MVKCKRTLFPVQFEAVLKKITGNKRSAGLNKWIFNFCD